MLPNSRTNINEYLHEYALLEVFDQVPLQTLMEKIDKVCTRWAELQRSALCRRREFTLLVGDKPLLLYGQPFDVFLLSNNSPGHGRKSWFEWQSRPVNVDSFSSLCNRMVTLMPNITKLHVVLKAVPAWTLQSAVSLLTSRWSTKIEHLRVYFEFDQVRQEDSHQFNANLSTFFEAINKMPRLRRLLISLFNRIFPFDGISKIDLPILSRLEEFCFFSYDSVSIIYESLKKHAQPNEALKQIKVSNSLRSAEVEQALQVRAQLAMRVKFLAFENIERSELTSVIAHFSSLTCVLLWCKLSLPQIIKYLSPLKQLSWLRTRINVQEALQSATEDTDDNGLRTTHQLLNIKTLILSVFGMKSHKDLVRVHLPSFFPGLEKIEMKIREHECSICKVEPNSSIDDRMNCLEKGFKEIAFAKLRLIQFSC